VRRTSRILHRDQRETKIEGSMSSDHAKRRTLMGMRRDLHSGAWKAAESSVVLLSAIEMAAHRARKISLAKGGTGRAPQADDALVCRNYEGK